MIRVVWRLARRDLVRSRGRMLLAMLLVALPGLLLLHLGAGQSSKGNVVVRFDPAAGPIKVAPTVVLRPGGSLRISANGQSAVADVPLGSGGGFDVQPGPVTSPTIEIDAKRGFAWRERRDDVIANDRRLVLRLADSEAAALTLIGMRLTGGRLPEAAGEVALSASSLGRLQIELGSVVTLPGGYRATVVGRVWGDRSFGEAPDGVLTASGLSAVGATAIAGVFESENIASGGGGGTSSTSSASSGPDGGRGPSLDLIYEPADRVLGFGGFQVIAASLPLVVLVWSAPALVAAAVLGLGVRRRRRESRLLTLSGAGRAVSRGRAVVDGLIVGAGATAGALIGAEAVGWLFDREPRSGLIVVIAAINLIAGVAAALISSRADQIGVRLEVAHSLPLRALRNGLLALVLGGAAVVGLRAGLPQPLAVIAYLCVPLAAITVVVLLSPVVVDLLSRAVARIVPLTRPGATAARGLQSVSGRAAGAVAVLVAVVVPMAPVERGINAGRLNRADAVLVSPDIRIDADRNAVVPQATLAALQGLLPAHPVTPIRRALTPGGPVVGHGPSPQASVYVADAQVAKILQRDFRSGPLWLTSAPVRRARFDLFASGPDGSGVGLEAKLDVLASPGPAAGLELVLIDAATAARLGLEAAPNPDWLFLTPGLGERGFVVASLAADEGVAVRFAGFGGAPPAESGAWVRWFGPVLAVLVTFIGLLAALLVRAELASLERALALVGAGPIARRLSAASTAFVITGAGVVLGLTIASLIFAVATTDAEVGFRFGDFAGIAVWAVLAPLLAAALLLVGARVPPARVERELG